MGNRSFFTALGLEVNPHQVEAKKRLKKLKRRISNIGVHFNNLDIQSLHLVKNVWLPFSENFSDDVQVMGINLGDKSRSMILHFEEDGGIDPHIFPNEFVIAKVLAGKIKDNITEKKYEAGDVFSMSKGELHHLQAAGDECYVYLIAGETPGDVVLDNIDQGIIRALIKNQSLTDN